MKDYILQARKIDKVSILELRSCYRELLSAYQQNIRELDHAKASYEKGKLVSDAEMNRIKEKYEAVLSRTRANRDKRINNLTYHLFKHKQKVYALTRDYRKKIAPVREARVKNKREVMRQARLQGFQAGLRKSFRIREQQVYRAGYREGQRDYKIKIEQTRRGLVNRNAAVGAIARTALLINKLSKALSMPPEYVSIFLWIGEYDSFFFNELKAAMEVVGDDLFYRKIYFLKGRGYLHKIAHKKEGVIWALTPLGREIYSRVKAFITKHINETRSQPI